MKFATVKLNVFQLQEYANIIVSDGQFEETKYLVENFQTINTTTLLSITILFQHESIMYYLLSRSTPVNRRTLDTDDFMPSLYSAILIQRVSLIKRLTEKGAKVCKITINFRLLFREFIRPKNNRIRSYRQKYVIELISKLEGYSLAYLTVGIEIPFRVSALLIIMLGVDVNSKNKLGETILQVAIRYENLD